jgi:hypothetical protein
MELPPPFPPLDATDDMPVWEIALAAGSGSLALCVCASLERRNRQAHNSNPRLLASCVYKELNKRLKKLKSPVMRARATKK